MWRPRNRSEYFRRISGNWMVGRPFMFPRFFMRWPNVRARPLKISGRYRRSRSVGSGLASVTTRAAISSSCLTVQLAGDDVQQAERGDGVGHHAALDDVFVRGEEREARGPHLDAIWEAAAVRHERVTELAVRAFGVRVDLPRRHLHALEDELEVVDEPLHLVVDHLLRGQDDPVVVRVDGPLREPREDLLDDPHRLADLLDAHDVPREVVAVGRDRDVEVDLAVHLVGLVLADVVGDAGGAEARAREAPGEGLFLRYDAGSAEAVPGDLVLRDEAVDVGDPVAG